MPCARSSTGLVPSVVTVTMASSPLVYSFDMNCVECPSGKSNWWRFVLVAFLPLTVFYFVILLFKINVTSSHLHGFVYFSQGAVNACNGP